MATSFIGSVPAAMSMLVPLEPRSVLDIGVGFGRWGYLCRELLDALNGRVAKPTWQVRIEGIEIYEPYIQDHQRFIYDQIHIGNAAEIIKTLGHYDLVIIGDMLEHLEKDAAWELFHDVMERVDKGFLLNLPIGKEWLRETGNANKYEDHLSWWLVEEFAPFNPRYTSATVGTGSEHATFLFEKENYHYGLMMQKGLKAQAAGKLMPAIESYAETIKQYPTQSDAYLSLADLLIDANDIERAERTLEMMLTAMPDYHEGRIFAASLQQKIGKNTEAAAHLQYVLEHSDEGSDERAKAKTMLA